jgi:hypothetical protein
VSETGVWGRPVADLNRAWSAVYFISVRGNSVFFCRSIVVRYLVIYSIYYFVSSTITSDVQFSPLSLRLLFIPMSLVFHFTHRSADRDSRITCEPGDKHPLSGCWFIYRLCGSTEMHVNMGISSKRSW